MDISDYTLPEELTDYTEIKEAAILAYQDAHENAEYAIELLDNYMGAYESGADFVKHNATGLLYKLEMVHFVEEDGPGTWDTAWQSLRDAGEYVDLYFPDGKVVHVFRRP